MPEHGYRKLSARAALRGAREEARRLRRANARWKRGQTLIIFALSFTVLLGMAGLALDVARAYDLYGRMQRAAEAGAIAGVMYMPNYYNVARTPGDGLSAVQRASAEVVKDGLGSVYGVTTPQSSACPTVLSSVEVAVCPVANLPTDLEVFVTERMSVVLLGGLGLQPITLQAKAQAEYIPPVQVGSRESYFGDQVECSPANSSNTNTSACQPGDAGNHLQYFMATMNGPAELKESGDPMVYCAEGNADAASLTPNGGTNGPDPVPSTSAQSYTYNGYPTDHPQWPGESTGQSNWSGISQRCGKPVPGGNPGNPDYQPDGYTGAATAGGAHPGGYNYFIGISASVPTASLWIYNPYYIPTDSYDANCNQLKPLDHFIDNTTGNYSCVAGSSPRYWSPNFYEGPNGEGLGASNPFDGQHHDAPLFFFNVTYTLYQVGNLYGRPSDTQVAVETFPPYDGTTADLNLHGCALDGSQVYNPYWQGSNTPNNYYQRGSIASGGTYHGSGCTLATTLATGVCSGDGQWCQLMNCVKPFVALTTSACTPVILNGYGASGSSGMYRLVVEATGLSASPSQNGTLLYNSGPQDGWGAYTYALKVCSSTTITSPINCANGDGSVGAGGYNNTQVSIYGWNNADVTFQQSLGTATPNANYPQTSCVTSNQYPYACMDLGCLTSDFAGRTVTMQLFDPGDGYGGDLYIGVAMPYNGAATVSYGGAATTTIDGDSVVHTANTSYKEADGIAYRPYNGVWLNVTIKLASNYQGDCYSTGTKSGKSGWFQLAYMSTNGGNPTDTLAVQFTLVGSPDHLVPAA